VLFLMINFNEKKINNILESLVMPHSSVDFSRGPVGVPEKILYLPARSPALRDEGRAETSTCLQTKRMIPYIKDYSTNGQCYPSP
jgi:hypothetical protein